MLEDSFILPPIINALSSSTRLDKESITIAALEIYSKILERISFISEQTGANVAILFMRGTDKAINVSRPPEMPEEEINKIFTEKAREIFESVWNVTPRKEDLELILQILKK